eukprot:8214408-Alexandrium_andersonii.AAC.1
MGKGIVAPVQDEGGEEDAGASTTLEWADTLVEGHSNVDALRARLDLELRRVHREAEEHRKADLVVRAN